MADTNFINGVTVIRAEWLNDINSLYYDIFDSPTSIADVRAILNLQSSDITFNGVSLDTIISSTIVFDTVADMVSAPFLLIGMRCRTLGYNTIGDGGGNDYEIVAAGTGTDDGGSFIDLAGSGLQAKGLFLNGLNVLQFGAREDVDSYAAMQAAIDLVETGAYTAIDFGGKIIRKDDTSPSLFCVNADKVTFFNGGIFHNDTDFNPRRDLIHFNDCGDIVIKDFIFEGTLQTYPNETNQSQNISGSNNRSVLMDNVTIRNMRFMATSMGYTEKVVVVNSRLEDILRDGWRFTDCTNVTIANTHNIRVSDDVVALHGRTEPESVATNHIVVNNTFTLCQQIRILGAKNAIVNGNTFNLMFRGAVELQFDPSSIEGRSPMFALQVCNNVVTDTLTGFGSNQAITILAEEGRNVSPANWVGVAVAPETYNYIEDVSPGDPNAAMTNVIVANNILMRTRPSTANLSDYGFGQLLNRADSPVYQDPAVTDASFSVQQIVLRGPCGVAAIRGNQISGVTAGASAILVTNPETGNGVTYMDLDISSNQIRDVPAAAVSIFQSGDGERHIRIKNNYIDCDPYFRAAAHNADNTWSNTGTVIGFNVTGDVTGFEVGGNVFKNCGSLGNVFQTIPTVEPNIVYSDFVASGDDVGNKGVRLLPNSRHNRIIPIDGDPTSATFNAIENTVPVRANSAPTTGRYVNGTFIHAATNSIVGSQYRLGWARIGTGSSNILGVDWIEVTGNV